MNALGPHQGFGILFPGKATTIGAGYGHGAYMLVLYSTHLCATLCNHMQPEMEGMSVKHFHHMSILSSLLVSFHIYRDPEGSEMAWYEKGHGFRIGPYGYII